MVKLLSACEPSASGINSVDEEGWSPLHSAASSGNEDIVEILLSRGDDIKCSFFFGSLPLGLVIGEQCHFS